MMGRLEREQEQLFYSFFLSEAVPEDHPVRRLAAVLDLSWVHAELAPYYPKIGRPSTLQSRSRNSAFGGKADMCRLAAARFAHTSG